MPLRVCKVPSLEGRVCHRMLLNGFRNPDGGHPTCLLFACIEYSACVFNEMDYAVKIQCAREGTWVPAEEHDDELVPTTDEFGIDWR